MHEKLLYEYAVIRYVPRVEREEFLNVGIVLFCRQQRLVRVLYRIPAEKIRVFAPETDTDELEQYLQAMAATASGKKNGGPIALEEAPERFRWLTAVRSSSLQTSRPHPGFCSDPEKKAQQLLNELVG